ncbi:MAG: enoyl-CoA hydratase/isomerase family protein [Bacteroidota bacterium]
MKIYQFLDYVEQDRIAYLTLNRPDQHNALNNILIAELKDAIMRAEHESTVKVMVLKANGPSFCTGEDASYLRELQHASVDHNIGYAGELAELMIRLYRSTKVVIAQVEGNAMAGGCGLLTACDFSFVVPEAKLGFNEVRIGSIPSMVIAFLLRKVGETRTKELLLSGNLISASVAERYNLITRIVPQEEIHQNVYNFGQQLCHFNSGASMQLTKKMIADIHDFPLENSLKLAAKMHAHIRSTEDFRQALTAYMNNQPVRW